MELGLSGLQTHGLQETGAQPRRTHAFGGLLLAFLSVSGCGSGSVLSAGAAAASSQAPSVLGEAGRPRLASDAQPSGVFLLDGRPLCFLGSNSYYLIYKPQKMVDDVLDTAKAMGIKVMRQWAFTDRGSLDGKVPAVDGDGTKDGRYFQYWDETAGRPAYNDGDTGLQKLDYLLYKARLNDIRIVLVLTNNWRDFGGMDQYLTWYGLSKHHAFYSDARVKQAYKDYVSHLVNRVNRYTGLAYKDDPYIFAWNLANEPRMRNYGPLDSVEGWAPDAITQWVKEMSSHIRAIDANHMISVGDEGFYMDRGGAMYSGEEGVDHDALIALDDIDYTTFHLYPEHWGQELTWGDQWIEDHLVSGRKVGKPTVLEEYNVAVTRDGATQAIVAGGEQRAHTLQRWHDMVANRGAAGAMFWLLAGYDDSARAYYKDYDQFTVYSPDIDATGKTMQAFAERMSTQAQACSFATSHASLLQPRRPVPPGFVTTSKPELVLQLVEEAARSVAVR